MKTQTTVGHAAPESLTKDALRHELREAMSGEHVQTYLTDDQIDLCDHAQLVSLVRKQRGYAIVTERPLLIMDPGSYDYSFDGHAGAGPSGAERWMNCTASLQASRDFLDNLTPNQQYEFSHASMSARQGTTAHNAGEIKLRLLLGEIEQEVHDEVMAHLTTAPPDGEEFTEEMDENVDTYVEYVAALETAGFKVSVEQRVTAIVPLIGAALSMVTGPDDEPNDGYYEITGSADATAIPDFDAGGDTLHVVDLKYGNGIDVSVSGNPQTRIYALGVLTDLMDDEGNLPENLKWIEYAIVQPRLGGIKVSREPVTALLSWRDSHLAPALSMALVGTEGGATFNPSPDACQFCPARGGCTALAEQTYAASAEFFDVVHDDMFGTEPLVMDSLSNERLGELLLQANEAERLRKDLKEEAQRRLHRGEPVKHFDLVNYSPKRDWTDEGRERLGTKPMFLTEPTLVSPTEALRRVKADLKAKGIDKKPEDVLGKFIHTPDKVPLISTGPKDRRSRWQGKAPEDMFADESGAE